MIVKIKSLKKSLNNNLSSSLKNSSNNRIFGSIIFKNRRAESIGEQSFKITTFFIVLFFVVLMLSIFLYAHNIVIKPYLKTYHEVKPYVLAQRAITCLSLKTNNERELGVINYSLFKNNALDECFLSPTNTVEFHLYYGPNNKNQEVIGVYVRPVKQSITYPVVVFKEGRFYDGYAEIWVS